MNDDFYKSITRGVEAKLLQYEEYASDRCESQIDLRKNLGELFKKQYDKLPIIMINLQHHVERYHGTVKELEKVSCTDLVHLTGTYWKNREQFSQDLTFIMQFLSQFCPVADKDYKFDFFSETADKNILIQDGPLACYCSHLRAMIYGYTNFEDYTIVVEDDILISNTDRISQYISQIPDDWDVICLGAAAKFRPRDLSDTFYKFADDFHSTHFYIIRNKCFPKIFSGMYPITDQVDVLLSNMIHELNIYNIPYCVFQKSIETNTQNNLNVIFNSPNYDVVRVAVEKINKQCEFFCNLLLPDNAERNSIIADNLVYDIVYEYVLKSGSNGTDSENKETYDIDYSEYVEMEEYKELHTALVFFIRCCKKGIEPVQVANGLLKNIFFTIKKFNTVYTKTVKAYGFGSSAHVYRIDISKIDQRSVIENPQFFYDAILKIYNTKLRWTTDGYDDPLKIYENELRILKAVEGCIHTPKKVYGYRGSLGDTIKMAYAGESLYDKFNLPEDWQGQIKEAFDQFDSVGVYYPEFRLQNILVKDGHITFVDYGMAELSNKSNSTNCEKFCRMLNILSEKFAVTDPARHHELINTLYRNITLEENGWNQKA